MDDPSSSDPRFADLVEELQGHARAGRRIDTAEYLRRYPDYADQIENLVPALDVSSIAKDITSDQTLTKNVSSGSESETELDELELEQLGDFRIIREIGRGGMGVVFEARETSLDRRVAIKVLPFSAITDKRKLARFKIEAQAAAGLHHHGIVPVYSVGYDRGVHFYAMQYVDGISLSVVLASMRNRKSDSHQSGWRVKPSLRSDSDFSHDVFLDSGTGVPFGSPGEIVGHDQNHFRAIAELGIQAAEALEHAHQSGVIHRDIKPANLLLDSEGKLWVTDFGLARVEQDSELTMTGDLVGTLRYMSPEQIASDRGTIDPRCDVYSLGATLYELLTLKPAFVGEDRQELLSKIVYADPVPPSRIDRGVPEELETIVMKAMEKESAARYPSAQALADDLRCYLSDRPISARRPTPYARLKKWSRRHPALIRSALVVAAVLVLSSLVGSVLIFREQQQTAKALARTTEAVAQFEEVLYVRMLGLAADAWHDGDGAVASTLLQSNPAYGHRDDLRGFAWRYLFAHLESPQNLVFRADETFLSVAVSPDGDRVVFGNEAGKIRLIIRGSEPIEIDAHEGPVHSLCFDPTGNRFASCSEDGSIRIWKSDAGSPEATMAAPHDGQVVYAVRFSHSGSMFASVGEDVSVRLWDAESLKPLRQFSGHEAFVRAVEFSPDDRYLATGSNDRDARLWEIESGDCLHILRGHTGMVLCLAFTPDDRYLVTGSNDQTIRFWNRETGHEIAVVLGHRDGVQSLQVFDDGTIVAGDRGGNLRIWKSVGRRPVDRFSTTAHPRLVAAKLAPGGDAWAALTSNGQLLWRDLAAKRTRFLETGIVNQYALVESERLAFAPDGTRMYCSDRLLTLPEGRIGTNPRFVSLGHPTGAPGHFSPDSSRLAVGWSSTIRIYDAVDGSMIDEFGLPVDPVAGLRYEAGGNRLITWSLPGPILTLNANSGAVERSIGIDWGMIADLELSPQTDRIAACSRDGSVHLYDAPTGSWRQIDVGERKCDSVGWLDDTTLVLSSPGVEEFFYHTDSETSDERIGSNLNSEDIDVSVENRLFLRNVRDICVDVVDLDRLEVESEQIELLQGHTDRIWSISRNERSRQFYSASRDGTIRRWPRKDQKWQWLDRPRYHGSRVRDFNFSHDGTTLHLAETDQCSEVDWPSGTPLCRSECRKRFGQNPMGFSFRSISDGPDDSFLSGHLDGTLRVWDSQKNAVAKEFQAADVDYGISIIQTCPDRQLCAASSHSGNRLCVWNTSDWQVVFETEADDCDDFQFSPDGRLMAYCDSREVVLVDTTSFEQRERLASHSLTVHGVAFSPDGNQVASASEDRKLRLWDVQSGNLLRTLRGHRASIKRVVYSPDGTCLVSGDVDGTIKLWDLRTGQELYTLAELDTRIEKLAFAPGGKILLALAEDGRVYVFDSSTGR